MIPRITHQTAATRDAGSPNRLLRQRLVDLHPGWAHAFYDDAACRELVRRECPYLLPLYDSYRLPVQRTDLFRVVAVYVNGGFYLDMDVECHTPLDELLHHGCVLGEERTLTDDEARRLGHEHPLRVANYMFGSVPRHPFWLDVLDAMAGSAERVVRRENDVLESTGPGLLTNVYHRVKDRHRDLVLIRNPGDRCRTCASICCQFGRFASHFHLGSWRWEREQVVVLNTYGETPNDGLSSVFALVRRVGRLENDTRHLANCRVLVAGVPTLYVDRLSRANTNILYSMFESTRLPQNWIDAINAWYRGCIVPHEGVRQAFVQSGVRVPVAVNQLGYTRLPQVTPPRDGVFRVGFLGVPVRRKNLAKLVDACRRLLPAIPSLRLAIHVSHFYDWLDRNLWDDVRAASFVEWSEGTLSDEELAGWFGRLSCYVYPSSGEGWSFTPREAMFLGVPTALTAIPVHQELVDSGFCTVIGTDGFEAARFEGGTFGQWHRIRAEDIARAIVEIHARPGEAEDRSRRGAKWIEGRWLNVETERRLIDLLERVPTS